MTVCHRKLFVKSWYNMWILRIFCLLFFDMNWIYRHSLDPKNSNYKVHEIY